MAVFTPIGDLKDGPRLFEDGVTYNAEKQNISDEKLAFWHRHGWIEVSGWDKAQNPIPGAVRVSPNDAEVLNG